ncbi:toll/interleukin-1 receptor domain-containing protein [Streptomyces sp. ODS28]|uniref:toll/interleukin-1 receptor domain-containing protein n=1 Tax=Streptomyces sp. ODS28 TaxID=3136688 RepID=UPI0031E74709
MFVSYARAENPRGRLLAIKRALSSLGQVYIDDLEEHDPGADRTATVMNALTRADLFVAVHSRSYLRTEWTRLEFHKAQESGREMRALMPDMSCVNSDSASWPWPAQEAAEGSKSGAPSGT